MPDPLDISPSRLLTAADAILRKIDAMDPEDTLSIPNRVGPFTREETREAIWFLKRCGFIQAKEVKP